MAQPKATELTPALGAEISGVDLGTALDDDTIVFLRRAFDERGVLLFRNTDLDRARQFALVEVLRGRDLPSEGEATIGATAQRNFYVSNKRENSTAPVGRLLWHSDGAWTDEAFEVLSLYAEDVETPVAATMFASATNGWDILPPTLQARLQELDCIQVGGLEDLPERRRRRYGNEIMQTVRDNAPEFQIPISRPHPRTGHMTLLISENHAKEIVGVSAEESDRMLDEVFGDLYSTENTYAHEWRNGDLVIWDNISIQHSRQTVLLEGPVRTLRKVGLPVPTSEVLTRVQTYQLAR